MSDRNSLFLQLDVYQPFNDYEARSLERLRRFVGEHEDCFERTLPDGHVTGSAWVVDLEREHVLLTHHVNLDKWLQLGGHADGEPDVLKVALREAREESGLQQIRPLSNEIFDVDVHEIPARGAQAAHYHYDIRFLFEADRRQTLQITAESKALAWVKITEVCKLTGEESVLRMVAKTPTAKSS